MEVVEYYLFPNLDQLLEKDPGRFPALVGQVASAGGEEPHVSVIDGYGFIKALRALRLGRCSRRDQVVILFHLNIRTLAFVALTGLHGRKVPIIIKGDLTPIPANRVSPKERWVWRALASMVSTICVETPEAQTLLAGFGILNAVFVPNHIELPGESWCVPAPNDGRRRIVMVTRSTDPRKRPAETLSAARHLAAAGYKVTVVGLDAGAEDSRNLQILPNLKKAELIALLRGADAFVGMSRSESFWFLVAEAAALGIPALCTPTGIAPYLAGVTPLVRLLEDPHDLENLKAALAALLEEHAKAARPPFDINLVADRQLHEAVSLALGGHRELVQVRK